MSIDGDIAAEGVLGFYIGYQISCRNGHTALVPRPFGRGDTTPLRESPEGAPKLVAIDCVKRSEVCSMSLCGCSSDGALFLMGDDARDLWSEPENSKEPPLCHLAVALFDLLRLLYRRCFCVAGVWLPASANVKESCDDHENKSEVDSVVEEPELAIAATCEWLMAWDKKVGRGRGRREGAFLAGGNVCRVGRLASKP